MSVLFFLSFYSIFIFMGLGVIICARDGFRLVIFLHFFFHFFEQSNGQVSNTSFLTSGLVIKGYCG